MSTKCSSRIELTNLRDVKIHVLITLTTCAMLHETRTTSLDLNTTSSFLLNVLYISSTVANNLCTEVKALNRFKINRNLLLGPFTLRKIVSNQIYVV